MVGRALLNLVVEPRQDELEPVSLLDFIHQIVNGESAGNTHQQVLYGCLIAVNVQQSADNLRGSGGIDSLDINLNKVGQTVLVKVKNQVMYKIKSVADNNKRELVVETGLLEEVLDFFGIVKVGLSADTLDLTDLASTGSRLNVLEVNLGVFAEVDNGTEVVVQTFSVSAAYSLSTSSRMTYRQSS